MSVPRDGDAAGCCLLLSVGAVHPHHCATGSWLPLVPFSPTQTLDDSGWPRWLCLRCSSGAIVFDLLSSSASLLAAAHPWAPQGRMQPKPKHRPSTEDGRPTKLSGSWDASRAVLPCLPLQLLLAPACCCCPRPLGLPLFFPSLSLFFVVMRKCLEQGRMGCSATGTTVDGSTMDQPSFARMH